MRSKRVDLVFFDGGGGHRSAANALRQAVADQGCGWDVRLVNLGEILYSLDPCRRLFGRPLEDVYNRMLKEGWTLGAAQWKALYHWAIRLSHSRQVDCLERYWRAARPGLVVSLVPHFNRALAESTRRALPDTPFVTIMTDIADYPPHFWIESQPQHIICGSERAAAQALEIAHPALRIWQTSGMIVHPRFYEPVELDRAAERRRLGLAADLPTALVLFGGEGSQAMVRIARKLDAARIPVQIIFLCGRNHRLAASLGDLRLSMPHSVQGFTHRIPYYMRLADFFIGKPGPGCLSEALLMRLPVIVERNVRTLPQERYNTEWVEDNGLGIVIKDFSRIDSAVARLLDPGVYFQFRRNIERHSNRAVHEIPPILRGILAEHDPPAGPLAVLPALENSNRVWPRASAHPSP